MNSDKARDLFSAYYEETLDAGLREAFERALDSDRDLKSDYDAFCTMFEGVDSLKNEQIPVPYDLHEKISRKLDHHIYEASRAKQPFFLSLRPALIGVAAIAAIALTVFSINSQDDATSKAGMIASPGPIQPSLVLNEAEVRLFFNAGSDMAVNVFNSNNADHIDSIQIQKGQTVNVPLTNSTSEGILLTLNSPEFEREITVALPPATRVEVSELRGTDTLGKVLTSMAEHYNRPVQFVGREDLKTEVDFDFNRSEIAGAIINLASGSRFQVELRESGLVVVSR